jgi:signal transduction histidine kinase
MVVLCLRQLWPVSAAGLRRLAPVPLAMVGFATGVALRAVALHSHGVDDPRDGSLFAAYVVMGASLVALSGAVLDDVARRRGERRALGRIVTELAEAPRAGSLQAALAAALGDPKLRMAYWLPASRCWVDAGGFKVPEPQSDSATVATRLTQGEETVAVVLHAAGLADVGAALGAAARLGIDNERLQADVLAQLHEIRASRSRIVETGDNERRRLERDLHDGAQQRLLALSYDLRLAQSRAATSGEVTVAERLGGAVTETLTALAELRELAGGIYPAALTEVGLVAALQTFAASTPLPVEVTGGIDQRWPGAESAAYFAVADAVDDAQRRGASYVHVTLAGDAARLLVTVTDDGALRQDPGVEVADRVGALGGEVAPVVAGLRMEIPCG